MCSMRTYEEARKYSKQNPDELVKFSDLCSDGTTERAGFFLNGKQEGLVEYYQNGPNALNFMDTFNSKTSYGEHKCFWKDGSVASHHFTRKNIRHGEVFHDNLDIHYFVVDTIHISELDDLVNEPRDESFYFTLSLYGIDKEYTIGA